MKKMNKFSKVTSLGLLILLLTAAFLIIGCNNAADERTDTPSTNPFVGTWKITAVKNIPLGLCDPLAKTDYAYTFSANGTGVGPEIFYDFNYNIVSDTEISISNVATICGIGSAAYYYKFTTPSQLVLTLKFDTYELTLTKQ